MINSTPETSYQTLYPSYMSITENWTFSSDAPLGYSRAKSTEISVQSTATSSYGVPSEAPQATPWISSEFTSILADITPTPSQSSATAVMSTSSIVTREASSNVETKAFKSGVEIKSSHPFYLDASQYSLEFMAASFHDARVERWLLLNKVNGSIKSQQSNNDILYGNQITVPIMYNLTFSVAVKNMTSLSFNWNSTGTTYSATELRSCDQSTKPVCSSIDNFTSFSTLTALFSGAGSHNISFHAYNSIESLVLNFQLLAIDVISTPLLLYPNVSDNYFPSDESIFFILQSKALFVTATFIFPDSVQREATCVTACPNIIGAQCQDPKRFCYLNQSQVFTTGGKHLIQISLTNHVTMKPHIYNFSILIEKKLQIRELKGDCDDMVPINTTKLIKAQYSGDNALISWKVNNSLIQSDTTQNLNYRFSQIGDAIVNLTISNRFSTASRAITITVLPAGSIHGLSITNFQRYRPTNESTKFYVNICGGETPEFSWNFGDGNTRNVSTQTVSHTYVIPGKYGVEVTARNHMQRTETKTRSAVLQDKIEILSAYPDKAIVSVHETFKIVIQISHGTSVKYALYRGNTIQRTHQNSEFQHLFESQAGNYTFEIKAKNEVDEKNILTFVLVQEPININIQQRWYVKLNVSFEFFTSRTSGTDMLVKWYFGDGSESSWDSIGSNSPVISHSYSEENVYNLTVFAVNNVTSQVTKSSLVVVQRPIETFTVTTPSIYVSTNESFSIYLKFNGPTIFTYNVSSSFGKKVSINNTSRIEHVLKMAGAHDLSFTAESYVDKKSAFLEIISQDKVLTPYYIYPKHVPLNSSVSLTASAHGGTSLQIRWIFLNETNSQIQIGTTITHTFATLGKHVIQLQVSNQVSNKTFNVDIYCELDLSSVSIGRNASIISTTVPALFYTSLTDRSEYVYAWFIDGISIGKGSSTIIWHFSSVGFFNVSVNISNNVSNVESLITVEVQEPILDPVLQIVQGHRNDIIITEKNVTFQVTLQNGSSVTYFWTNSLGHTGRAPKFTFIAENLTSSVNVCLNVSNKLNSAFVCQSYFVMESITKLHIIPSSYCIHTGGAVNFTVNFNKGSNVTFTWLVNKTNVISSEKSVLYRFQHSGNYNIKVAAINNISNASTEITIHVLDTIGNASLTPRYVLFNEPATFTVHLTKGTNVSYDWILPSKVKSSVLSKESINIFTFTNPGEFSIRVNISNLVDHRIFSFSTFAVESISGVSIHPHDMALKTNQSVNFSASYQKGNFVQLSWSAGSQVENNPILLYFSDTPGAYVILVNVSNYLTWSIGRTSVTVQDPISTPEIDFCCDSYVLVNRTTNFSASVTKGTNVTFTWSLPLSSKSLSTSNDNSRQLVIFTQPGKFTVTVNVSNLVDSKLPTVNVNVLHPVGEVVVHRNTTAQRTGEAVSFIASFMPKNIFQISWSVNGNKFQSQKNQSIVHFFNTSGIYVITANVSNYLTWSVGKTFVTVQDPISTPKIEFCCKSYVLVNQTVNFTASVVRGTNVSYNWILPSTVKKVRGYNEEFIQLIFTKPEKTSLRVNISNLVDNSLFPTIVYVLSSVTNVSIQSNATLLKTGRVVNFSVNFKQGNFFKISWSLNTQKLQRQRNQSLVYRFEKAGAYLIFANVSNYLTSSVGRISVTVQDPVSIPKIEFCCNTYITVNQAANFTASVSKGTNATFFWQFIEAKIVSNKSGHHVTYTPRRAGNLNVIVNASNRISWTTASVIAIAQNKIDNLVLWTSESTVPAKTEIQFKALVSNGSHLDFIWYVNNSVFQNTSLSNFTNTFNNPGLYNVSILVQNDIPESAAFSWTLITVKQSLCDPPVLSIIGGTTRSLQKSKWFYAEADIQYNCSTAAAISRWTVKHAQSTTSCLLDHSNLILAAVAVEQTSPLLEIPPTTFSVGWYCVLFSLVYGEDMEFSKTVGILLRVDSAPLIPVISGGEQRVVGSSQTITLDGSSTIDPDISFGQKSMLLYKWTCKLVRNENSSCYESHWRNKSALILERGYLEQGRTYLWTLEVKRYNDQQTNKVSQTVSKFYSLSSVVILHNIITG